MAQLIVCPNCRGDLRVPDALIGQTVRCPTCNATFGTSASPDGPVVGPVDAPKPASDSPPPETSAPAQLSPPRPDEDRLEEVDVPPRFRRRDVEPHRGSTILVLGILSLVSMALCFVFMLILGPIAWVMGSSDLKKIRAGTMDPQGEGNTNAGRICGIIATVLGSLYTLGAALYIVAMLVLMVNARNVVPPTPAPMPPRAPVPPRVPARPRIPADTPKPNDDDPNQSPAPPGTSQMFLLH
jgi:predicted Zn finger-like uncharacterized protein